MTTKHQAGLKVTGALLVGLALGGAATGCDNNGDLQASDRYATSDNKFPSPINANDGTQGFHYGHHANLVVIDPSLDGKPGGNSIYTGGKDCYLLPSNKNLLLPDTAKPSDLDFSGAQRPTAASSEEQIQDIVVVCKWSGY
jgi:hypothetical protein